MDLRGCHRRLGCASWTVIRSSLLKCTWFSPMRPGFNLQPARALSVLRISFQHPSSGLVHCSCLSVQRHDAYELDLHTDNPALTPSARLAEASVTCRQQCQRKPRDTSVWLLLRNQASGHMVSGFGRYWEFRDSLGFAEGSSLPLSARAAYMPCSMTWRSIIPPQQNWRASLRPGDVARSKSVSSSTFAAQASAGSLTSHRKSNCHGAETFASLSLNRILGFVGRWPDLSRLHQHLLFRSTAPGTPTVSSRSASLPMP